MQSKKPYTWGLKDKNELIFSHILLTKNLAVQTFYRCNCEIELDILIAEAFLALTQASRSFDPSRNTLFWTYAEKRIQGALCDAIRR